MMQDGTAYLAYKLARDDGLLQKAQWYLTLKGGKSCTPHSHCFVLDILCIFGRVFIMYVFDKGAVVFWKYVLLYRSWDEPCSWVVFGYDLLNDEIGICTARHSYACFVCCRALMVVVCMLFMSGAFKRGWEGIR